MSEILREIVDSIEVDAEVRGVGVFRCAAAVESRHAGVAYGFWDRSNVPTLDGRRGGLQGGIARELCRLSLSSDPVEAAIGVAAINSLLEPAGRIIEKNGYQMAIERAAGKRLAVVGHFPFVEEIAGSVEKLWVLELRPGPGDLPVGMAPEIIPRADVVMITGTTLVNHTADGLLKLAHGKTIIMLGPTTVMSPVLFDYGVSAVCGVRIIDSKAAIDHLRRGGGMRDLEGISRICLVP